MVCLEEKAPEVLKVVQVHRVRVSLLNLHLGQKGRKENEYVSCQIMKICRC